MSEQANTVNFPDILGTITRGTRLTIGVVQCAAAVQPAQVVAGQAFDLVLLLQNASDGNVDVTIEAQLPRDDRAGQKDRFAIKTKKLLIGLRPAEVGVLTLPVTCATDTSPGSGYRAALKVGVRPLNRQALHIRRPDGGGRVTAADVSETAQDQMRLLRRLTYSAEGGGKKDQVWVTFAVQPRESAAAVRELKARYEPLWTVSDLTDDLLIARQVWGLAQGVVQRMKRQTVFMPLLKASQERFEACGFALLPPEAIYIAKMLTFVAEMPIATPSAQDPRPSWPSWFTRLCRLLLDEPALAEKVDALAIGHLYGHLLYDAAVLAFAMLTQATQATFGTPEEIDAYARRLATTVVEGESIDFARAYLPLILGGLLVNLKVTMPREQVRETVFILSKALETRQAAWTEDNDFVFEMLRTLIERGPDMA